MRKYKRFRVTALCLLILLACGQNRSTVDRAHRPAAPPGLTGTRSGLVLNESRVEDIQASFGPTMVYKTDLGSSTSYMCYVSTFDFTLVSFTIERNVMTRLQLLADKHRYNRWDWCTATPLSTDNLTLGNGLTLAMNPDDITRLVGDAHRKERDRWLYRYGWTSTTRKIDPDSEKGRVKRQISMELRFSDLRLVKIDLQALDGNGLPAANP